MRVRTIKLWVGIISLFPILSHASPIGLYIRPTGVFNLSEAASAIHCAYQFNPNRAMELAWTIASQKEKLHFMDKHMLPLSYHCNVYLQWGVTMRPVLVDYDPFIGCGIAYHFNRQWYVDVAWQNYGLIAFLRKGVTVSQNNSFTVGVGYCFD